MPREASACLETLPRKRRLRGLLFWYPEGTMRRLLARRGPGILALAVLLACLLHPAAVWAADEASAASLTRADDATFGATVRRAANATFDVLILRPTGLAVLVVGVGLFVPATILSSPGGKTHLREAWDRLVVQPANYAVTRPLGDF